MKLLRPLLLLTFVVGSLLAVYASPLGEVLKPTHYGDLQARIAGWGVWAPVLFVAACTGAIGVGAPRLALATIGGLAFGWWEGFLLAQVGTMGGCMINFGWARWLGRRYVEQRVGRRFGRLLGKVARRPIATNVMLRICPVGNNFLVNLFFGVSPISTRDYVIGTFVGTLPETLILAIIGSSVHDASTRRLITGASLLAALTVAYYIWSRRSREAAEIESDMTDMEARSKAGPGAGESEGASAASRDEASRDDEAAV